MSLSRVFSFESNWIWFELSKLSMCVCTYCIHRRHKVGFYAWWVLFVFFLYSSFVLPLSLFLFSSFPLFLFSFSPFLPSFPFFIQEKAREQIEVCMPEPIVARLHGLDPASGAFQAAFLLVELVFGLLIPLWYWYYLYWYHSGIVSFWYWYW